MTVCADFFSFTGTQVHKHTVYDCAHTSIFCPSRCWHPCSGVSPFAGTRQALIEEWKQHAAWDLLLHTRDARRKPVRAEDLTEYGQLLVRGVDDGVPETLTADYLD